MKDEQPATALDDRDDRDDRDDLAIDPRPIPPRVGAALRTLECPPTAEAAAPVVVDEFARRAAELLEEIREAACDDLGIDGDVTALGVSEDRNTVTGARGLILRRFMRRGRYSPPLAELVSRSGLLELEGKQDFHAFRDFVYSHGLELWIHEIPVGDDYVYAAFAIFSEGENSDRFWYGARLLITPFEVGQWGNPFLEAGCPRPS